jgi:hypothetical protein
VGVLGLRLGPHGIRAWGLACRNAVKNAAKQSDFRYSLEAVELLGLPRGPLAWARSLCTFADRAGVKSINTSGLAGPPASSPPNRFPATHPGHVQMG